VIIFIIVASVVLFGVVMWWLEKNERCLGCGVELKSSHHIVPLSSISPFCEKCEELKDENP